MPRELLLAWYEEHGRDLPWRHTRDPYAILVSEVMLQQTQVERVVPRWHAWLERWPTVEALAEAPVADVILEWQGLGYNRRAVNLHRAAQAVAASGWPDDLTELPGVGPYTAGAVGNFAFGRDVLPVDTNVRRIQERTGAQFDGACTQALFDLGATICLARIPRCGVCPLAAACPSRGSRYEPLRKQSRSRARSASAGRSRCARSRPASSRATATRWSRSSATASSCCATARRRFPSPSCGRRRDATAAHASRASAGSSVTRPSTPRSMSAVISRTSLTVQGTTRSPSARAAATSSAVTRSARGPIVGAALVSADRLLEEKRRGERLVQPSRLDEHGCRERAEGDAIEVRRERFRERPRSGRRGREALRLDDDRDLARGAQGVLEPQPDASARSTSWATTRPPSESPTSSSSDVGAAASSRRSASWSFPRWAWISKLTHHRLAAEA